MIKKPIMSDMVYIFVMVGPIEKIPMQVNLYWGPFIKDVINRGGGRGVCKKMIY